MIFEISLSIIIVLICIFFWLREKRHELDYNLPAGPTGLPILGSLVSLLTTTSPHLKFSEWATTYGGVYTVTILTKQILIVSCPKLMRQIFDHPASSGKFDMEPVLLLSGGPYGVTSSEGSTWSEQRSFCIRTLRRFGMGKRNEIQSKILSEAEQAIQWIRKESENNKGVIHSPINLLRTVTSNTLWKIVRGDRFPLNDMKVKSITGDFLTAINTSVKSGLAVFPWLKYLAPKWSGYTDLVDSSQRLREFIREQFEEHEVHRQVENGDNGEREEPRDMLDAYLEQMEKSRKSGDSTSSFYGEVGLKHSVAIVAEMFAGGGESTPHTLNWLILYVSHCQSVQQRLHEEIDRVLGTQEPSLLDKSRMPYTEAVLLETLRKCPAFPLTTAHKLTEDVEVCGFKLPQGLLLISNIYQAHMDKQFWGDPENFRPERFLPEDALEEDQIAERKAAVVVFNVGKRVCLGEPLAMDVLFLFVVKLFQTFHLSLFPENSKPDFESSEPFFMIAKTFGILVKERNPQ